MKNFKVGVQLYTIRDEMEKDMDAALKQVKEIGYDYVEFAGYFGRTADEVKNLLHKHDLECASVHQAYSVFLDNPKESVEYLKTIGSNYCAIPWMGKEQHKGSENFAKTVDEINQVGALLKEAGITLLYHNHDYEFECYQGKFLLDWLYDTLPKDHLQTEIDTCWVKFAGQDPAEYIRKYTGRSPVVHLKDFTSENFTGGPVYALIDETGKEEKQPSKEDLGFHFKALGEGVLDISSILQASEDAGTDIVVVEQDQCTETSSLEAIRISREYLKSLGL